MSNDGFDIPKYQILLFVELSESGVSEKDSDGVTLIQSPYILRKYREEHFMIRNSNEKLALIWENICDALAGIKIGNLIHIYLKLKFKPF